MLTEKIRRVADGTASRSAYRVAELEVQSALLPQAGQAPCARSRSKATRGDLGLDEPGRSDRTSAGRRATIKLGGLARQGEASQGEPVRQVHQHAAGVVFAGRRGAGKSFSRYQAGLNATASLIAAERHRRKTGTWPASIAAIDRDILPRLPIDAFSGQPFVMEHRDGES